MIGHMAHMVGRCGCIFVIIISNRCFTCPLRSSELCLFLWLLSFFVLFSDLLISATSSPSVVISAFYFISMLFWSGSVVMAYFCPQSLSFNNPSLDIELLVCFIKQTISLWRPAAAHETHLLWLRLQLLPFAVWHVGVGHTPKHLKVAHICFPTTPPLLMSLSFF